MSTTCNHHEVVDVSTLAGDHFLGCRDCGIRLESDTDWRESPSVLKLKAATV